MSQIVNMKKYRKREKVNNILLYCVDNSMETRYITAEFKKQNLLIRFTHFNHLFEEYSIDYICVFSARNTIKFIKLFADNKSDFLYYLQSKFNTSSASQDIMKIAENNSIKYKIIEGNNFDDGSEILIYYPNGKIEQRIEYKNGKKCGFSTGYYNNGKIKFEYTYKNGKKYGICRTYYYSGKIRSECEYKNGKKNGVEKRYYSNGQLSYEHEYKNGLRDGWSISYEAKTGEIQYKIFFRKGNVIDFKGIDGITGVKGLETE